MKTLCLFIFITCLTLFSGCAGNLSPRDNLSPNIKQKLDKLQGDQNNLENNQNSIRTEIMRMQDSLNNKGDNNKIQQGFLNFQADGVLIGCFSFAVICLMYYIFKSEKYKNISNILAKEIHSADDENIKENIFKASWGTTVEKDIAKLMMK